MLEMRVTVSIVLGLGFYVFAFAALGYIPPTIGAALQEVIDLAAAVEFDRDAALASLTAVHPGITVSTTF